MARSLLKILSFDPKRYLASSALLVLGSIMIRSIGQLWLPAAANNCSLQEVESEFPKKPFAQELNPFYRSVEKPPLSHFFLSR
jgi:hypothetical protein